MGWGEFLDCHVEKRLILFRLFFADSRAPLIELLISFEQQDDLRILKYLADKFRMLPDVTIELQSQECITFFEDAHKSSIIIVQASPWFQS